MTNNSTGGCPVALDFEKAEKETVCGSKLMVEMAVSGVRHHLNAQHLAAMEGVRKEEREKIAKLLDAEIQRRADILTDDWSQYNDGAYDALTCLPHTLGLPEAE